MYLLRRVAIRAISQQPSQPISNLRPASRVTTFQSSIKPTTLRALHQSRICFAGEQDNKVEEASPVDVPTSGETVPPESSATEQPATAQDAVSESSGTTADPIGHSEAPASESSVPEPSTIIERAQEVASSVAAPVAEAASNAAQTATSAARSARNTARDAVGSARDQTRPQRFDPSRPPRSDQSRPQRNEPSSRSTFRDITPSRILYIGNLFFEVTAPQLKIEFERLGEVTNSRVVTDARGMSKGFGYVEFADQESADKAVRELDQKVFQGRRMAVQYHVRKERSNPDTFNSSNSRSRAPAEPSKTLFIGNMSYQMSDRDLNDLFREIRNVLDVRVAIDRRSGQPRGFAHADFIDIASAQRAKEHLETKTVYGRQLKVDFSQSTASRQTPDNDE